MKTAIADATVSCTSDVIRIAGVEKACKNFYDATHHSQIICNSSRFSQTSESDQYVLIHHEYAGLSGIEVNGASGSYYAVSNEITESLTSQTVLKLAVKPKTIVRSEGYLSSLTELPIDGSDSLYAYISHIHAASEATPYDVMLPKSCGNYDPEATLNAFVPALVKDFIQTLKANGFAIVEYNVNYEYSGTDQVQAFEAYSSRVSWPFAEPMGSLTVRLKTAEGVILRANFLRNRTHDAFWRNFHKYDDQFYHEAGFAIAMATEVDTGYDKLGQVTHSASRCHITGQGVGVTVVNDTTGVIVYSVGINR